MSQDALFQAVHDAVAQHYGDREQPASVVIVTRSGLRLRVDFPPWWQPSTAVDAEPSDEPARAGPGYRSVYWFGRTYGFSKQQANVVEVLWKAWRNRTPDVGDEQLRNASGTASVRLADVFRDNDAWGTMIVEGGTRGTHRLKEPEPEPEEQE